MNEERVQNLVEAINAYENKEGLFAMTPEEATKELNANGNDFTVEEMVAMGEAISVVAKMSGENGELDMDALEQASGGGAYTKLLLQGAQCLCVWGAVGLLAAACAW